MAIPLLVLLLLLTGLQGIVLIAVSYLVVLTIAAWYAPKTSAIVSGQAPTRFAILVPAHNEEVLLPKLLESINRLEYPKTSYKVHVIADNCTDRTAAVAQKFDAIVHIRQNDRLIGKGHALQWGLSEIQAAGEAYDAYIFVDADSLLLPNFLNVMHSHVCSGAKAVQSYYAVKDPETSWVVSLRFAALAVLHYLRPLGRSCLGGSAGLKGNGMLVAPEVLNRFNWSTSITEDIEYHMTLLLNGYVVEFAPDAVVSGEMPNSFDQSRSQLDRWEAGRLEMARRYVPKLLGAAWKAVTRRNIRWAYRYLDAAMEHLIPPFSILFGGSVLLWLLELGLSIVSGFSPVLSPARAAFWGILAAGMISIAGQVFYLISGLKLVGAPRSIYIQLVYTPLFGIRKLIQYIKVFAGSRPQNWVKTTRNQDKR